MRAELMCEYGTVQAVSPVQEAGKDAYALNGMTFERFAEFNDVVAYVTRDGQASDSFRESGEVDTQTRILRVAMPLPMGSCIYPAPVLWISKSGVLKHWKQSHDTHGKHAGSAVVDLDHLDEEEAHSGVDVVNQEELVGTNNHLLVK